MKVLITGGSGMLGEYLNIELSKEHDILTLYNSNPGNCLKFNHAQVDITNEIMLQKVFFDFKPEAVVHTAAVSNQAKCEILPEDRVVKINVEATKNIARFCKEQNCKLIFTSTDLVYDGESGSMLKEDAKLNPLSFYAETKLLAEKAIRNETENFLILRTALLFGKGITSNENYFQKVYDNFKRGRSLDLFSDQFRTPLAIHDAARIIGLLLKNKDIKGIINFGGKQRVSRADLAEILCKVKGISPELIKKIKMEDANVKYPVYDVSMDTSRLQSFGISQESIESAIERM